jgi:hypothetical protein
MPQMRVVTKTTRYPQRRATPAQADRRAGRIESAAVLGP